MIKILTDSTSTITQKEAKQQGITVVPLTITLGDKSYLDGISTNSQQVTKYDDTHKKTISHSSQPAIGKFVQAFRKLTSNGDSVLAIMIGSNFSGTYNSARQAAQIVNSHLKKNKIEVVDSKTTDQSLGHMVSSAAKMARSKKYSINTIKLSIKEIRQHSKLYMGVSTLRNLRKNGRINMMASMISVIFHLYIIVDLDISQKLHVASKGRGKKTFYRWFKQYASQIKNSKPKYIGISYTGDDSFPKYAAQQLHKMFPTVQVNLRYTSATVTCHAGKNAFAIMTCDR